MCLLICYFSSLGLGPATCEFLLKNDGVLRLSSSYKCLQCLQYHIYRTIDKDSVSKFSPVFHNTLNYSHLFLLFIPILVVCLYKQPIYFSKHVNNYL